MKIFGLELGIGQKPTYLSSRTACDFNNTFLSMFEAFVEKKEVKFVNGYGFQGISETPNYIGFIAGSRIRKWLQFWQLITAEQKKDVKEKYYLIKPTSIGWDAYAKGAILKMDVNGTNSIDIGVGKPYGVFTELWKEIDAIGDVQCTKATRANWEYEFQKKYLEAWVGKTLDVAKPEILKWNQDKIAASPKRKKFGSKSAKIVVDNSQKDLFAFVKPVQQCLKKLPKSKPLKLKVN